MSAQTLRSLVVSVSAETSAYQREMARASRMGSSYLRTIGDGNRQAATGWKAQQSAIQAQNNSLQDLTASAGTYVRAMAGALALGSAITEADNWGQVSSRLKMATQSQGEYLAVSDKLMEISDRTYKRYSDQAELFITSAKRMRDLGYSTEVTLAFVDSLSSGLTVSAANAEDTAQVIRAASEAIGLGALKGDQFRAMVDKAPAVIEAMADSLGITTAALENMSRSGDLVTSKWLPALIAKQQELADKTEAMPTTVGDAFTRLSNHYGRWLGEQNEGVGVTQNLAAAINLLSDNLDTVAVGVVALGAGGIAKYAAEGARALVLEVTAMRAAASASLGRAKAQLDVAAATVRSTQAEVIAAQRVVEATRFTDAHTAALARQRAAKLADLEATRAQTAAQATYTRAASVGSRVLGGVTGVLGGPAGLAIMAATTAASFLLFADNADKANSAASDLSRPIKDLREEWEALGAAQQRPILTGLVQQQAEARKTAAEALQQIRSLAQGPDKWGDSYTAAPFARDRAATSFRRDIAAGVPIDSATQDLVKAIGPTQALRTEIEKWAASYAEAIRESGAAGNQIAELSGILDRGKTAAGGLAQGLSEIKSLSPELAGTWEKKIAQLTEAAAKAKDASNVGEVRRAIATDNLEDTAAGRELAKQALAAAAVADAEEKAKKAREDGARAAKTAADEVTRNAKQLDDNYKRTLATLQQQAELHGKTTELARIRYETSKGELKTLTSAKVVELEKYARAKDALDAQQSYKTLLEGAGTAEERLVSQMRERVRLLREAQAAGGVTPDQYAAAEKRFSKAAIQDAPKFGGLDAAVGGAAGELVKVAEAQKALDKWRTDELARQKTFLDEKLINEQTYADRVAEITTTNNQRLADLASANKVAQLGMFSDLTSNAADMLGQLAGEGSAAYKAMFLASKAAAIAQAMVSTELAAAKALELGPIMGIPAASLVRGLGYASVGMIAATALTGMAHDGIDNIPKEGTWLLQRGERVLSPRQNADFTQFLANAQGAAPGAAGMGAPAQILVQVTVDGNGQASASTQVPPGYEQFGENLGRLIDSAVREAIRREREQGGVMWRAA